jgi:hypothetical protein
MALQRAFLAYYHQKRECVTDLDHKTVTFTRRRRYLLLARAPSLVRVWCKSGIEEALGEDFCTYSR